MASHGVNQEEVLKNNDLIWAKINDGSWWPGQITSNAPNSRKKLYRVDFFGENQSHAFLPLSKITKYGKNDTLLQKGRISPSLKRAISQANILYKILEQSKIEINPVNESKPVSLGSMPDEKTALIEPERNQEDRKVSTQTETEGKKLPLKLKQVRDYKMKNKKIKKLGIPKKKPTSTDRKLNTSQSIEEESLEKHYHRLLVRKLYKLLKRDLSKAKSQKLAIKLAEKKKKTADWRSIFEECINEGQRIKRMQKSRELRRIAN